MSEELKKVMNDLNKDIHPLLLHTYNNGFRDCHEAMSKTHVPNEQVNWLLLDLGNIVVNYCHGLNSTADGIILNIQKAITAYEQAIKGSE